MSQESLTAEHVRWAYRLLLDREVESNEAVDIKLRAWRTTAELRLDIMASEEFGLKNPDHATSGGSTVVIKPLADGTRLFVDLSDHVIGRPIVRDAYEQAEVRLALSLLREGDVAVDIGAHVGFFTIQLARAVGASGHVYAFEPSEANAGLLTQSIAENGFASRITLERQAVSDRDGQATFLFAERSINSGGGFLGDGESAPAGVSSRQVRTIRLDGYPIRQPIRLIKLDVEGAEPAVIAGASALIARDRPFILSEVHPEQLARVSGASPASVFAQLAALGMWPHRIAEDGVGPRMSAAEITGVTTIIFTP
jgi:FkbM family methyltransferase